MTARTYYEESEALLRSSGDKGDLARLVHTLGYIAQHEGDYTRAETQFRKSLAMFRRLGNRRGIAECLAGLAGLRARQGQPAMGANMLGAAETLVAGHRRRLVAGRPGGGGTEPGDHPLSFG